MKNPWRREWQPTPVFLLGEFHGQRNLVGYSIMGHKELDMTEQLTHTHTCNQPQFSSVQSLSRVWLFPILWTAACQASLSITTSWNLLKFMSIESVMPPNHLILCHPFFSLQSSPESESFPMSQFFALGGQSIGTSVSVSVLPMNIQDWSPLGFTGVISLQSKEISRVFSNTMVQKHQFFDAQLSVWSNSHPYMTTGKTIALT